MKAIDADPKPDESAKKSSPKKSDLKEDIDSGQLFFSTDGTEPDKEEKILT